MQRVIIISEELISTSTRGEIAAWISITTKGLDDEFRDDDCPEAWEGWEESWEEDHDEKVMVKTAPQFVIKSIEDNAEQHLLPYYSVIPGVLGLGPWKEQAWHSLKLADIEGLSLY